MLPHSLSDRIYQRQMMGRVWRKKKIDEEEGKEKEEAGHSSLPNGTENPLTQSSYDGQVFRSLQALVPHLKSYAKAVGFQWRTRTSRKDKNKGGICTVSMVCSKEGANKSRGKKNKLRRPSLREGCNVSVTSSLKKDGWWKINKINLLHCHENDPKVHRTPLPCDNASRSIDDAIMGEQPSFEGPFFNQFLFGK
ncbi:hypothetical protein Peur_027412 [Populus x canadensis]